MIVVDPFSVRKVIRALHPPNQLCHKPQPNEETFSYFGSFEAALFAC